VGLTRLMLRRQAPGRTDGVTQLMTGESGERGEPGSGIGFTSGDPHGSATSFPRAAATPGTAVGAVFLGLAEQGPAALHFCPFLGGGAVLEGLIALDEVEADAIDAVSSMNGGFHLGLAAVEGVEEGEGDRGVVLSDAVAHLIEAVAELGVAVLGKVADALWAVAGAVGEGVEASEGPDLGIALETIGAADACQVGGGVHVTEAGDGGQVAGWGVRQQGHQSASALLDEGFGVEILAEETLELIGQWGRDLLGEQDGVVSPGAQGAKQGWAGAAHVLAKEGQDFLIGHGAQVIGIGTML